MDLSEISYEDGRSVTVVQHRCVLQQLVSSFQRAGICFIYSTRVGTVLCCFVAYCKEITSFIRGLCGEPVQALTVAERTPGEIQLKQYTVDSFIQSPTASVFVIQ